MNEIASRVDNLRLQMRENRMDVYIIPSADFHQSEYVGDYFKARAYITGFTGSAGTAVVTQDRAALWTDGRYFLQAEQQLRDTPYELMKMGEEGVLTVDEFLEKVLPEEGCLGFDGRVISLGAGMRFEKIVAQKNGKIRYEQDLIDDIWTDRPQMPAEKAFLLEEKYAGESISRKLARVREEMRKQGANVHVLTSLDDICWLCNLRGNDIAYSPLVLSYAIIEMERVLLFVDETKFDEKLRSEFAANKIEVRDYNDVYEVVKDYGVRETAESEKTAGTNQDVVLLDPSKMNYALYENISDQAVKVEAMNPTTLMKAVKNRVEIENIKKAHVKDAVAVVKLLCWLKSRIGREELTEISVSDKLEDFRRQQEGFIEPSFAPISAYGEHAAIVHYEATEESNAVLKPEGLLLMDTGGHYYEGTTDITRTIALGPVAQEEREHFTIVAISMLSLANAKFLYGCDGSNLDVIAREPFWKCGLNFNHGTGHGVGYLMNVHEGPNAFRWKSYAGESYPLEAGMVTTDEPGLYIAGSHGIRTENELLTVKAEKNEYGQFMEFEYLTFVPIDLEAIDVTMMTKDDIEKLNQYHEAVYEKISPYLTQDEQLWLKENTRRVG